MRISVVCVFVLLQSSFHLIAGEFSHRGIKVKYSVEKVPEWTELFRRTSGWTGADGIFSYHDLQSGKNLFVFSDTWIGEVDPKSRERKKMEDDQ